MLYDCLHYVVSVAGIFSILGVGVKKINEQLDDEIDTIESRHVERFL
jgi:hypothetical protein